MFPSHSPFPCPVFLFPTFTLLSIIYFPLSNEPLLLLCFPVLPFPLSLAIHFSFLFFLSIIRFSIVSVATFATPVFQVSFLCNYFSFSLLCVSFLSYSLPSSVPVITVTISAFQFFSCLRSFFSLLLLFYLVSFPLYFSFVPFVTFPLLCFPTLSLVLSSLVFFFYFLYSLFHCTFLL